MGEAFDKLVRLTRIYVPPYVRVNERGHVEHVDGYWREVNVLSDLTMEERRALGANFPGIRFQNLMKAPPGPMDIPKGADVDMPEGVDTVPEEGPQDRLNHMTREFQAMSKDEQVMHLEEVHHVPVSYRERTHSLRTSSLYQDHITAHYDEQDRQVAQDAEQSRAQERRWTKDEFFNELWRSPEFQEVESKYGSGVATDAAESAYDNEVDRGETPTPRSVVDELVRWLADNPPEDMPKGADLNVPPRATHRYWHLSLDPDLSLDPAYQVQGATGVEVGEGLYITSNPELWAYLWRGKTMDDWFGPKVYAYEVDISGLDETDFFAGPDAGIVSGAPREQVRVRPSAFDKVRIVRSTDVDTAIEEGRAEGHSIAVTATTRDAKTGNFVTHVLDHRKGFGNDRALCGRKVNTSAAQIQYGNPDWALQPEGTDGPWPPVHTACARRLRERTAADEADTSKGEDEDMPKGLIGDSGKVRAIREAMAKGQEPTVMPPAVARAAGDFWETRAPALIQAMLRSDRSRFDAEAATRVRTEDPGPLALDHLVVLPSGKESRLADLPPGDYRVAGANGEEVWVHTLPHGGMVVSYPPEDLPKGAGQDLSLYSDWYAGENPEPEETGNPLVDTIRRSYWESREQARLNVANVQGPGLTIEQVDDFEDEDVPKAADEVPDAYPEDHPFRRYAATYFESITCSRCGGSGYYWTTDATGSRVCYKCGGRGRVHTTAAERGFQAYLDDKKAAYSWAITELQPGDVFWEEPGPMSRGGWRKVASVEHAKTSDDFWTIHIEDGENYTAPAASTFRVRGRPKTQPPSKETYEGYVGFTPVGWHFRQQIGTPEGTTTQADIDRVEREAFQAAADARMAAATEFTEKAMANWDIVPYDLMTPQGRNDYRTFIRSFIAALNDDALAQFRTRYNVGISEGGRDIDVDRITEAIYDATTPSRDEWPRDDWRRYDFKFTPDRSLGRITRQEPSGWAEFQSEGGPKYIRMQHDMDNAYGTGTWVEDIGEGKTNPLPDEVRPILEAMYREAEKRGLKVKPKVSKKDKAALRSAAEQVSSNLTPAYVLLRDRKVTDEDMNPDLIDAATSALVQFESELGWSEFLMNLSDKIAKGGTLSPKQARGVLNALRKQVIKHVEGRAQFEANLSMDTSAVDRLVGLTPIHVRAHRRWNPLSGLFESISDYWRESKFSPGDMVELRSQPGQNRGIVQEVIAPDASDVGIDIERGAPEPAEALYRVAWNNRYTTTHWEHELGRISKMGLYGTPLRERGIRVGWSQVEDEFNVEDAIIRPED